MNESVKVKKSQTVLAMILMMICIMQIETIIKGMKKALIICATSVIPSLFIFMVFSEIIVTLISENNKRKLPIKYIIFILGSLCGFPVGATVCKKFYESGLINKYDAERLIPFCNNASPAFVIGAVGTTMLNSKMLGLIVYLAEVLASLFPVIMLKISENKSVINNKYSSLSETFFAAVEKSTHNIFKICSLICIFTSVLAMLENTPFLFFATLLELSCGCSYSASILQSNAIVSVVMIGFCCGFSGLCVHAQIQSIFKISYKKMFICKLIQGILCSVICFLLLNYLLSCDKIILS